MDKDEYTGRVASTIPWKSILLTSLIAGTATAVVIYIFLKVLVY